MAWNWDKMTLTEANEVVNAYCGAHEINSDDDDIDIDLADIEDYCNCPRCDGSGYTSEIEGDIETLTRCEICNELEVDL